MTPSPACEKLWSEGSSSNSLSRLRERVGVRDLKKISKPEINFLKKFHNIHIMDIKITKKELIEHARELRKNSTPLEKIIWYWVRNRQLLNCKFRRQHPIGNYIVDFVCYEIRLIIEIDGGQHNWRARYDKRRTHYLEKQGFTVMRYWNNDVAMRLNDVMEDIYSAIEKLKNPHPNPLPQAGEGLSSHASP